MVEFTAHRGESRDAPENTLAAFRLAWERRVRSVELDVHLSRDGVLVVHHDADTRRMTGEARVIRDLDFRDLADLRHRDGGPIPRLDDVLREMPADGRVLVEIKSGAESVESLARCLVATGAAPGQVQVICFEADVLAEVRRRLPELTVQFLAEFDPVRADAWREDVSRWIDLARSSGFHGLGLDRRIPLDRRAVEDVRNSGLGLHIWTVDDLDRASELVGLGIRAITSNRAAWLRDHLGERMVSEPGSG